MADGQQSDAIGAAARQRRVSCVRNIQNMKRTSVSNRDIYKLNRKFMWIFRISRINSMNISLNNSNWKEYPSSRGNENEYLKMYSWIFWLNIQSWNEYPYEYLIFQETRLNIFKNIEKWNEYLFQYSKIFKMKWIFMWIII